jgi:hypothetical protein
MQQFIFDPMTMYNTESSGVAQHLCVVRDNSVEMGCQLPAGAGSDVSGDFRGVTLETIAAAGPQSIQTAGIAKIVAYGAISIGDPVLMNTDGQVLDATNATAASTYIIGYAETASTNTGDLVSVSLAPQMATV